VGIVVPTLISNVPLSRLVPPILHMEIGLISNIINYTERWIHVLFDPSPSLVVEVARLTRLDCLPKRDQSITAVDAFYGDCRLLSLLSRMEDLEEGLNDAEEEELLQLQLEESQLEERVVNGRASVEIGAGARNKAFKVFWQKIEEEIYLEWRLDVLPIMAAILWAHTDEPS
jgi:hypothetical protein